jgi:hypothetical protein
VGESSRDFLVGDPVAVMELLPVGQMGLFPGGLPFRRVSMKDISPGRIFGVVRELLPIDPSVPEGGQSFTESLLGPQPE